MISIGHSCQRIVSIRTFFSRRSYDFIEAVLVPEVVRAVLVCDNDNGKLGVGFNGIYAKRSVGEVFLHIGS